MGRTTRNSQAQALPSTSSDSADIPMRDTSPPLSSLTPSPEPSATESVPSTTEPPSVLPRTQPDALPSTPIRTSSSSSIFMQSSYSDRLPQGLAGLLGVAILENPRLPDPQKPRSIILDATFWIGSEQAPLSACFRLYNSPDFNLDFSDSSMREKFVVFAMVSKSHEKAEFFSDNSWEDYDVIGDIIWIASAKSADAQQRPLMMLTGQAGNIDKKNATFEMVASQYVQQLRTSGTVPASITIPDVPRFKNKKPLPATDGTNATVIGFLNGVHRLSTMAAEFFRLTLESVVFYPRAHSSHPVPSTPTPPSQRGSRGRRLHFEDVADSDMPSNPSKRLRYSTANDDGDVFSADLSQSTTRLE